MSVQGPGVPPQQPPGKATNPLVWLAVGCGAFIVVAVGALIAGSLLAWNAARSGKTVGGAFSAGVRVELDGGALAFDAGAKTGPPPGAVGPSCEQAAACCRAVFEKAGANPASLASCAKLSSGTEAECKQALETYRTTAKNWGAVCP